MTVPIKPGFYPIDFTLPEPVVLYSTFFHDSANQAKGLYSVCFRAGADQAKGLIQFMFFMIVPIEPMVLYSVCFHTLPVSQGFYTLYVSPSQMFYTEHIFNRGN